MTEVIIAKEGESKRPKWYDLDSYGSYEDWSYKSWAWEFLRRNPLYQAKSHIKGPGSLALANTFGRLRMKPFKEGHDADAGKRIWVSEEIRKKQANFKGEEESINFQLAPGEVALVFDLNLLLKGGKAVLAPQFDFAKGWLEDSLKKFEKTLPSEERAKSYKPRRSKLLIWLRVYDAMDCEEAKAANTSVLTRRTYKERVARILYPQLFKSKKIDSLDKAQALKKLASDYRRAKHMVEEEYLTLVPLDFIQDKSKRVNPKSKEV